MLIPERQSRLQSLLAERGISDLDSLARELGVSASTVRRDVAELEERGLVRKTHGGVIWAGAAADGRGDAKPDAFEQRLALNLEAKKRIARAAKSLVQPGETILLDGGTTTYYLASELLGTSLQLVTNSLPIAGLFQNDEHAELVLIGGVIYPRYGVLLGPAAETMLDAIHTKTLFLSPAGIHNGSLYNQNMLLVRTEQKMMEQAQRIVLLADSQKFGQQALVRLCGLDRIDVVVTDTPPSAAFEAELTAAGCEVVVATANGS